MKRYILRFILFLLPFALSACAGKESFTIGSDPYLRIVVNNTADTPATQLPDMSAAYVLNLTSEAYSSAASASKHVAKSKRFHISSNLRWKILPADGQSPDWIHPFPESGDKDGVFFFKAARNTDPAVGREVYYSVYVELASGKYEPIQGMIHIVQAPSPQFLETSAARFSLNAAASTQRLIVSSNVDWSYRVEPKTEYATADIAWIEDLSQHSSTKQTDTLRFAISQNNFGVRGADIIIDYELDGTPKTEKITLTQYPAVETFIEGFPVKWVVRHPDYLGYFSSSFPANGTIPPVSGDGIIVFNNDAGRAADKQSNVLLDYHDNSPRATGVWPGDYCSFIANPAVSAGSIVKLVFATRSSASGQKYWRLEYKDGETWKICGTSYTEASVLGPDGKPVVYTHAMNENGATNVTVEAIVIYSEDTDRVEFRFICAANARADGKAAAKSPNTGTWRLSVDEIDANDEFQPQISIIAAGSRVLVPANLSVAPSYLAFEGNSNLASAKRFTVTSDQPFTITPDQDWIHVSESVSEAGENLAFTVYCDASSETSIREGSIVIKAGITRTEIPVIQAGAGGGEPVDPDALIASWSFPEPGTSWVSGKDFSISSSESGAWVYSDTHAGKLSVNRDAGVQTPANATTYKRESATFDSKVWLRQDAMEKGCYWLIEAFNVDRPAGKYTLKFRTCASASGPKYFLLQYSLDGGASWTDVNATTGTFYYNDDETTTPFEIKYTYWLHSGNTLEDIEESFTLSSSFNGTLMLRAVVAEDYRASKNGKIDKAGSNRIGDYMSINFEKQ